ncbi:MAG: hypothetical protein QOD99_1631 [Chthoniobacter sp.]|jgi:uncharacterized membrane protein YkoI|nr:hypothetical protein [Chthoniobacter sp.]
MSILSRLPILASLAMLVTPCPAADEPALKDLPAAVQKTAREQVGDARIEEVEDTFEDGQRAYEVEFTRKGEKLALVIAPTGKIVQLEHRLSVQAAPAEIQRTVAEKFPGGTISHIKKIDRAGKSFFEVSITHAGKAVTVEIDPKGRLIKGG